MALEDLADDLSAGLIRQWIKSRGTLTAEDAVGLFNELSAADPELRETMADLIFSGLDDQECDRLEMAIENEAVRRGSRS